MMAPSFTSDLEQLTVAERAYLAGLFDGEGSVLISKGKEVLKEDTLGNRYTYTLCVQIEISDRNVIEWIQSKLPNLVTRIIKRDHRIGQRPTFVMRLWNVRALSFLRTLAPYLIIKQAHYNIAERFMKTVPRRGYHKPYSPEVWQTRLELKQELHELRLKGRSSS